MASAPTITILDVARVAGVSKGTVSRVINNVPGVAASNVEAIRKAMAQLKYVPLPVERRRGPKSRMRFAAGEGNIALLLLGHRDLKWIFDHQPVYASVIHGVGAALASRDLNLIVRHVPSYDGVRSMLQQSRWDGLVLFGVEPEDEFPEELLRTPAVWAMGNPAHFSGDHILPNHLMMGRIAAEYLHKRGHSECAMITDVLNADPGGEATRGRRSLGFAATMENAGGRVLKLIDAKLLGSENQVNEQRLAALLDQFVAATPRPTALFVAMDVFTASVYRLLVERKLQPGQDVQIVTCNNERPYLAGLHPAPAVVDIHADYVGKRAIERLLWRIKHPADPYEKVLIAPSIVDGEAIAQPY